MQHIICILQIIFFSFAYTFIIIKIPNIGFTLKEFITNLDLLIFWDDVFYLQYLDALTSPQLDVDIYFIHKLASSISHNFNQ